MSFYGTMHGDAVNAHEAGYDITKCCYCRNWLWTQSPDKRHWCARKICEMKERMWKSFARIIYE